MLGVNNINSLTECTSEYQILNNSTVLTYCSEVLPAQTGLSFVAPDSGQINQWLMGGFSNYGQAIGQLLNNGQQVTNTSLQTNGINPLDGNVHSPPAPNSPYNKPPPKPASIEIPPPVLATSRIGNPDLSKTAQQSQLQTPAPFSSSNTLQTASRPTAFLSDSLSPKGTLQASFASQSPSAKFTTLAATALLLSAQSKSTSQTLSEGLSEVTSRSSLQRQPDPSTRAAETLRQSLSASNLEGTQSPSQRFSPLSPTERPEPSQGEASPTQARGTGSLTAGLPSPTAQMTKEPAAVQPPPNGSPGGQNSAPVKSSIQASPVRQTIASIEQPNVPGKTSAAVDTARAQQSQPTQAVNHPQNSTPATKPRQSAAAQQPTQLQTLKTQATAPGSGESSGASQSPNQNAGKGSSPKPDKGSGKAGN
jgi:hypothetical protein